MSSISVALSDERFEKLKQLAREVGTTPEQLVQTTLEQWLGEKDEEFSRAADYVLQKNAELYRRLA